MKTKLVVSLSVFALMLIMSSCASIVTKNHQKITAKGLPGTVITDVKKAQPIAYIGSNGFAEMEVRKSLKSKEIQATKEGYYPKNYTLGVSCQPWVFGNILFGGIPGIAIDAATGKMCKYKDKMIDLTLTPLPENNTEDEVAVVHQPMRKAEKGIEDTIIRWYFDSDPRGARIFTRVISNCPEEVKNTNETYLTTTPLEETKSLSIPGLTYENSRNVTIEIKVSKRGYEDQVKRFNVRQALDQQEISSFFELVEKLM